MSSAPATDAKSGVPRKEHNMIGYIIGVIIMIACAAASFLVEAV